MNELKTKIQKKITIDATSDKIAIRISDLIANIKTRKIENVSNVLNCLTHVDLKEPEKAKFYLKSALSFLNEIDGRQLETTKKEYLELQKTYDFARKAEKIISGIIKEV